MAYLDQRSIVIPLEKDHSFHINSAKKKRKKTIRIKRKNELTNWNNKKKKIASEKNEITQHFDLHSLLHKKKWI